jgi:hypothetical protein
MQRLAVTVPLLAALGCGAPEPPGSTGGTALPPGPCGRGVGVVHTDYDSTNVSLLGFDGKVLSPSFISSATTGAVLSAKLTGDVVLPSEPIAGESLVLIDRYPASVLTWVDVESASVTAQLSVRSGFDANPHDYLGLGDTALVTRFNRNPDPKAAPLDQGDDVLVVSLGAEPAVVDRIDLSPAMLGAGPGFNATPHRMVRAGARVIVSLLGQTQAHGDAVASRLAVIDPATRTLGPVLVLDGLYECNGLAAAPDGERVAVSCSGRFAGGAEPSVAESAVVVVSVGEELSEVQRVPAAPNAPFGFALAWSGAGTLVANTFGRFSSAGTPAEPDRLVELELASGARRTLLESAGEPFTLGDVSCAAACSVCFASDAGRGVLHAYAADAAGTLGSATLIDVGDAIGLPPRWLGRF